MVQTIKTPAGETLVILPLKDYEALCNAADAADHAKAMADLARGEEEKLTPQEALALAEAPSPLAFWRKKRGLTQASLAEKTGMSQSAIADIERGSRSGSVLTLKKIAEALALRIEDLINEDDATSTA